MSDEYLEFSKQIEDMTREELLGKIAHKTGHVPPKQTLPKVVWNSMYAWFTGEFHVHPANIAMRDKVAICQGTTANAMNTLNDVFEDYGDHDDEDETEALEDFYRDANEGDRPRPLRRRELQEMVRAMEANGDEREWV